MPAPYRDRSEGELGFAHGSSYQEAGRSRRSSGDEAYASRGLGVSVSTPAPCRSATSETG